MKIVLAMFRFKTALLLLTFALISYAKAAPMVTPKREDLKATQQIDGSGRSCILHFKESASIIKNYADEDRVLLKAESGCIGWVKKNDLEYVSTTSPIETYPIDYRNWDAPDAIALYNLRKKFADSIATYYGDSTLFSLLKSEDFSIRHKAIIDSLYRQVLEKPQEKIEHWDYLKHFGIHPQNVFFAKMEWDSLKAVFSLQSDSIFDSIYTANRNQYLESIKSLPQAQQLLATIAIMDYEMSLQKKEGKSRDESWNANILKIQSLAEKLVQEEPQYKEAIYRFYYNIGYIPRRRDPTFYFAAGLSTIHLLGKENSVHGELLGLDLIWLGAYTPIGTFAIKSTLAFGINSGNEFTYNNEDKLFKHNSFLATMDGSIIYRPTISIYNTLNTWAIKPELGLGIYFLDDTIFYYSVGIRYEKSMGSHESNAKQPYGIINGWSIGLTSKWSGINFKGIALDIRWAFHT